MEIRAKNTEKSFVRVCVYGFLVAGVPCKKMEEDIVTTADNLFLHNHTCHTHTHTFTYLQLQRVRSLLFRSIHLRKNRFFHATKPFHRTRLNAVLSRSVENVKNVALNPGRVRKA